MLTEADAYDALQDMKKGFTSHTLAQVLIDRLGLTASLDSVAAHVRKGINPNESECLRNIETLVLEHYTGRHSWLEFHATALGREIPGKLRADQAYLAALDRAKRLEQQLEHWQCEAARFKELVQGDMVGPIFVPSRGARFSALRTNCKVEQLGSSSAS